MTENREVLSEVMIDVLEKLAFMFGDEVTKDELPQPEGDCVEASMNFTGHKSGKLGIIVPVEVAPVIAANVLGMDVEEDNVQDKDFDALKEVLNVICGNILTALEGDEAVFDLTVPETRVISVQKWNELVKKNDTVAYIVDDSPTLMYFKFSK